MVIDEIELQKKRDIDNKLSRPPKYFHLTQIDDDTLSCCGSVVAMVQESSQYVVQSLGMTLWL